MRIGIFGAGALGSLVGAYLSTQHEVALYGRPQHVKAIKENGLKIGGVNGDEEYEVRAVSQLEDEHFDLGIIGVKSYDTSKLLSELKQQRVGCRFIASLQNGLKDERLVSDFGMERVLGCVVNESAKLISSGVVQYSNRGASFFGSYQQEKSGEKQEVAEALASALSEHNLKTGISEKMDVLTWYKFMSCVPGFAISGALNYNSVEVFANPWAAGLFLQLVEETEKTTLAVGIGLEEHSLLSPLYLKTRQERSSWLEELAKKLGAKQDPPITSLVQDLRAGKIHTEADDTIGVFLEKTLIFGLEAVATDFCYKLIKAREQNNQRKKEVSG